MNAPQVSALLAEQLGCTAILGGLSRLVIDLNREDDAPGLLPVMSDGHAIPGNRGADLRLRDRHDEKRDMRFAGHHRNAGRCRTLVWQMRQFRRRQQLHQFQILDLQEVQRQMELTLWLHRL